MINLKTEKDLKKLHKVNTHPLVKKYLTDYLRQMMFRFQTKDISQYGNINYLEKSEEIESYREMQPAFATRIALNDDNNAIDISQLIFRQDNKMLIVFADPSIVEPVIKEQYCA